MLENVLWFLAIVSLCLPWMWPLSYVINVNVSDLVKRIRGKSIDDETWLDDFNEKLYLFNEKIAMVAVAFIWLYFTFPALAFLSIYSIFNETIMAEKVMFFMLFLFFFFTEIYLLVKELSFKKTTQQ